LGCEERIFACACKQRHTAPRIWQRTQVELPECRVCERTIREYVRQRKAELGQVTHETFVPQSYGWGIEAQVDCTMRSMASVADRFAHHAPVHLQLISLRR
jgi:hypothetical protein